MSAGISPVNTAMPDRHAGNGLPGAEFDGSALVDASQIAGEVEQEKELDD